MLGVSPSKTLDCATASDVKACGELSAASQATATDTWVRGCSNAYGVTGAEVVVADADTLAAGAAGRLARSQRLERGSRSCGLRLGAANDEREPEGQADSAASAASTQFKVFCFELIAAPCVGNVFPIESVFLRDGFLCLRSLCFASKIFCLHYEMSSPSIRAGAACFVGMPQTVSRSPHQAQRWSVVSSHRLNSPLCLIDWRHRCSALSRWG